MRAPISAVEVLDRRDSHRRLRLSWHPEVREIIVSHWRDNVCVATTPVGIGEIAGLVRLLVQALQDSALSPVAASPAGERRWGRIRRALLQHRRLAALSRHRIRSDSMGGGKAVDAA